MGILGRRGPKTVDDSLPDGQWLTASRELFNKSIDMLHTAYGFAQMAQRRPSPADAPIVEGFTVALALALRSHPEAPVAECVREVTHRLRSISTECDQFGLLSDLYRSGLDSMAQTAPHVPVDDVFWT